MFVPLGVSLFLVMLSMAALAVLGFHWVLVYLLSLSGTASLMFWREITCAKRASRSPENGETL